MKRFLLIFFSFALTTTILADGKNAGDQRVPVVKTESGWSKSDNDTQQGSNVQTITEGISYTTSPEGIFITMPKATSNVKLFSLTGEVVWQGNLVQGRFFIPVRPGIYFLRINNKSYKVVCK